MQSYRGRCSKSLWRYVRQWYQHHSLIKRLFSVMANKRHADITNIVYIMFHSYQYTSGTSNDVYSIITTQKNSYADWKTFLVLPEKTFFFLFKKYIFQSKHFYILYPSTQPHDKFMNSMNSRCC